MIWNSNNASLQMFIELMVSWTDTLNSDNRLYLGVSIYEILFPGWSFPQSERFPKSDGTWL